MLTVLIADDEVSICRLIKYLVPWEELGLELTDVVYNGFAAMDVIREKHVDILITDAKMPGCDGIELIKWCQENKTGIKCIVISGFRQFEYAHGAIRYGADAYLLKPIHQEELILSLKKVIAGILENKKSEHLQTQLENSKKTMKDYFISSYLLEKEAVKGNGHMAEDEREEINKKYMIHLYDGFYQMAYFKLSYRQTFSESYQIKEQESYILQLIEDTVGGYLEQFGCEHIESVYKSGIYSFINYRQMRPEEFLGRVDPLYEILEKKLEPFGNVALTIGLSSAQTSIASIRERRLCAVEAVNYRLRYPYEKVFIYDDSSYPKLDIDAILTKEVKDLIQMYSHVLNIQELKHVLFKCRASVKKTQNYDPGETIRILRAFFDIVFSKISADMDFSLTGLQNKLGFILDNSIQEADLWREAQELIDTLADLAETARKYGQNKPVANAKSYIDRHFTEPITLEDVAAQVHLNPRYLCKVFHEQTGVTYSEYLTARRMEYAAQELQKGRLTVAEIAEASGYQDVKYFTKLFKKQMGVRPSTYRRIYQ